MIIPACGLKSFRLKPLRNWLLTAHDRPTAASDGTCVIRDDRSHFRLDLIIRSWSRSTVVATSTMLVLDKHPHRAHQQSIPSFDSSVFTP